MQNYITLSVRLKKKKPKLPDPGKNTRAQILNLSKNMYKVSKRKVEYFVLTFIVDRHAVYIRYLGSAALRTDNPVNQGMYFSYRVAV